MTNGVRAIIKGLGRWLLRLASWLVFQLATVPLWTGTKLVRLAELMDGWSDALDPDASASPRPGMGEGVGAVVPQERSGENAVVPNKRSQ